MANVIHISQMVSLALHSMAIIAANPEGLTAMRNIANQLSCSENHLVKVLQRLTKSGFLTTVRGPKGGFKLAKPAAEITMLAIFEAIEGPWQDPVCPTNCTHCSFNSCIFGGLPQSLNQQFHQYLAAQTVADIAQNLSGQLTVCRPAQ